MGDLKIPWSRSALDSDRFHVNVVKANLRDDSRVSDLEAFCGEVRANLAIVRVDAGNLSVFGELQRFGYRIMDTLVYCHAKRPNRYISAGKGAEGRIGHVIRSLRVEDVPAVIDVAANAYDNYRGHYQADERLDKRVSDDVYVDWATRSCEDVLRDQSSGGDVHSPVTANEAFVVEIDKNVVAFMTMRFVGPDSGEAVLSGVHPNAQGKGIYRALIEEGMDWCWQNDCERMIVSTQIVNIAVQKVWARCGFEPFQYIYTLHKWFDESGKDRG